MKTQTLTIAVGNGKHAGLRDIKGRPDGTGSIVARNGMRWTVKGR